MRKYIILYIALCLHIAARGQTIADIDLSWLPQPTQAKALRYWIDDDIGSIQTTDILNGQHSVDVSSLINGLHTIHYQIIDSEDKVAAPYSSIFLKMESHLSESGEASTLRYWFDDKRNINICNANVGVQLLDASGLLDGLHTLHLQVVNVEGKVSYVASSLFLKTGSTPDAEGIKASKLIYWFDDEATIQYLDITDGVQMLDASELIEGLHTLHYQVLCNNGQMTPATSSLFLRMNFDVETSVAKSLRYWFDDEQTATEVEITEGVQMLDASQLIEGLHTVHYQIGDSKGTLGAPASSMFLKMDYDTNTAIAKSIRYWFDDDASTVQVTDVANGTQTLDVADMPIGLHTLNYQLIDSNGKVGIPVTRLFMKSFDTVIASGHNSIIKYQYWLNSNTEAVQTVALDEPVNPYTLIALLPVQQEPFRSSSFHFEIKDGKPMMYAKNDFYVRFYDAAGYFADDSRQYIDYSVSKDVKLVGTLQPTQTFNKVASNDVRWYTMQVAPGDTAAFKLSQPATVQVFAPSGEEVFKTSESASVKWSGIHTWENGTYYLAVHDVTGSKEDMTLEYMHMDKYDVVDWDVHRVGNGGCSTITFKGNGFRDLYAVDLYNSQGDSIKSVAVGFIDDANVPVTFNFTDAPLGNYDAVFHFTTEDKVFNNIVTVEEAQDIELALDLRYPSSFLRGTSTTYTITVTNKGNSTAYNVPMEIYLSAANSFSDITSVKFKDEQGKEFNNFTLDMIEERDSIDDETLAYIDELIQELDGLHTFIVKNDSTGEGEYGFTDQLITIAPNSSSTFYVEIKSSSTVNLKVRIPSEWITIHTESETAQARRKSNASESNLCCEKEKWECSARLAADIIGTITAFSANPIISSLGCVTDVIDLGIFTVFEVACADGQTIGNKMKSFWENVEKRNSAISKSFNTFLSCVTFGIGRIISNWNDELKVAKKNFDSAWDNYNNWKKKAQEAYKKRNIALEKADEAQLAHDFDLCGSYLQEAENAEKTAKLYEEWAESAYKKAMEFNEQVINLRQKIDSPKKLLADIINAVKGALSALKNSECVQAWKKAEANCPPNPKEEDGPSTPQPPSDPNDIYGYLSEAGSKFIADSVARVNYTIEFENDTTFATAAAHTIVIKDTLDSKYFDLNAFMPTGIRIGSLEAFLNDADVVTSNNKTNFVKTIDMRPEINAIAQVDGTFNQKNGIAQWTLQSLDPMTMEPTDDLMQGILPVNYNGTSGIGEVMFEVGVKQGKADGTQIKNRAGIVFDYEEAILTPTWTNIVDAVPPTSRIDNSWMVNDSTLRVTADAFDARSGVWKYTWYVQANENAPWWKEGETESPQFDYHIFEGIDYGFCVLATDSAGNVEQKVIQRERSFKTYGQDFEDRIDEANGQSSMVNGQSIYDLSGRRQAVPKENQVNIIDKKKVLIR